MAFADSSSALGWLNKASLDPVDAELYDAVSRWIGWTPISNEIYLYSQQIKGK